MKNYPDRETISYTLNEKTDLRRLFIVVSPDRELVGHLRQRDTRPTIHDYMAQIRSVIDQAKAAFRANGFEHKLAFANIFLADLSKKQLVRWMFRELDEIFIVPTSSPVMTYIPQCPADGSLIAVEIFAIAGFERNRGLTCRDASITIEKRGVRWCYVGDVTPDASSLGAYNRALWAFRRLERVLISQDMSPSNLVRTWIYQGNLTLDEGRVQRYNELNRARSTFFEGRRFVEPLLFPGYNGIAFPASTGIGADDVDITMAATAIATDRDDVLVVPIENPGQTPAFDYGSRYSQKSPKFSRATAIEYDDLCRILISGTASITDSETRFPDDITAQTHQTLDNIAALIGCDNLSKHELQGYSATLRDLDVYRVYIKNPRDYPVVRAICEERIGDAPGIYTIADVCRDDLLVEIEGTTSVSRG
ncbi:MAG TPA: hypothetical protein DEB39_03140 [Planctomycetaceae bacterium]|nr:hypothetical protein [Planctomycetaceae bacterium]